MYEDVNKSDELTILCTGVGLTDILNIMLVDNLKFRIIDI